MPAARLEVELLSAGYGRTRVIDGIGFDLPSGARLAVLGRNGMGKTTLLASLMGQTRHHAGRIVLGGRDITRWDSTQRALAGLGLVPQTRRIFASLTVEENLRVGLKHGPRTALAKAYALFPRLYERRGHRGSQLSGGEQQMLAMARTLLGEPSVLLLDEPLEGLAPLVCDQLMTVLAGLAADGSMTILLVEQKIEAALDFAGSVIILERGRIAWSGTPAELRTDHRAVDQFLGVGAFEE